MSTVKSTVIRPQTLYVSNSVYRALRALAMHSIDPLLDNADALGDQLLREVLATKPEAVERQKKIEAFFKELNETSRDE